LGNFGIIALLPFIISICFLLWKQDVLLPLLGGLFVGAIIVSRFNPLVGFLSIAGNILTATLTDPSGIYLLIIIAESIVFFSLLERCGFFESLKKIFAGWNKKEGKIQYLIMAFSGALFVERNLSALIVGLFSRPFVNSKHITPCKQAYLINTVGGSLWTLIPVSAFLPVVVAAIGAAFSSQGIGYSPLTAFYRSLGFQYYNIFSVFIAVTSVVLNKDILVMKRSAQTTNGPQTVSFGLVQSSRKRKPNNLSLYAGVCAVVIFLAVSVVLIALGRSLNHEWDFSGYQRAFIVALFCSTVFIVLYILLSKTVPYSRFREWKDQKGSLFQTVFYLVLSLCMTVLAKKLGIYSIISPLKTIGLYPGVLPMLIFVSTAVISFLTGSGLLTAVLMTPLAIQLTSLYLPHPLIIDDIMFASIGAVFSGATFGDINSPLSPLFIISTAATEAPLFDHFTSQTSYSLIAFFVTIVFGYLLFMAGLKPYFSISTGMLAIFAGFLLVNRQGTRLFS
jgi:Na+/H+ antiporter NhaC